MSVPDWRHCFQERLPLKNRLVPLQHSLAITTVVLALWSQQFPDNAAFAIQGLDNADTLPMMEVEATEIMKGVAKTAKLVSQKTKDLGEDCTSKQPLYLDCKNHSAERAAGVQDENGQPVRGQDAILKKARGLGWSRKRISFSAPLQNLNHIFDELAAL